MTITESIKIWEDRVFYPNYKFKKDTTADLDQLKTFIKRSNDNFVVIASSSESSTYKIGRYMIENGIKNREITFQDGSLFESFIDIDYKYDYQYRELVDDLISTLRSRVEKKWLMIPYIDTVWSSKIAIYFLTQIERVGCYGIVFYSPSEISGNLHQCICENITSGNILQFPKVIYKNRRHESVEDDEF